MGSFDEDTALVESGPGRYRGTISERWFVGPGPNGGLLAAQAVRAMQLLVAEPTRLPLSLTLHYLRAPAAGDIEIAVTVERAGRSTTAVSLSFEQEGHRVALALGTLAVWREGARDHLALAPPAVAGPEELEPTPMAPPELAAFVQNYEYRLAALGGAGEARVGGWIRTRDPRPIDHVSLAAVSDAFPPAVFALLGRSAGAPTIDLTIHFRAPLRDAGDTSWVLGAFHSGRVAGGYFEEDGELWSADGTLLLQSRQLAILREPAP